MAVTIQEPGTMTSASAPASPAQRSPARRLKLGAPRLLVVGCGDVGLRIVARTRNRYRVFATTTRLDRMPVLRSAGAVPLRVDLDPLRAAHRLAGLAHRVVILAPPRGEAEAVPRAPAAGAPTVGSRNGEGVIGARDPRLLHLLAGLGTAAVATAPRMVYVSTSGVYGDRGGARVDECTPVAPVSGRARRRLVAERLVRSAGAVVLRAPGIYAHDRLPLDRLRSGLPALRREDDVATNHIHAEDLARAALRALAVAPRARLYNVVDDSGLLMGDYFDRVADACGLPRPARLARAEVAARVSPMMLSFMSESRRIGNARLKRELRLRLAWPDVDATLAALPAPRPALVSFPPHASP